MNVERKIFLLFDFDGTLSPIARDPDGAILPRPVKEWLRKLSNKKDVKIGIVTGRSLPDIKRRVGLKNIVYAANHGMEIYHNGKYLLTKGRNYKGPIHLLAGELHCALSGVPGVIVEDKGLSVAVHFRKVGAKRQTAVKKIVKRVFNSCEKISGLQLTAGKKILEIRPAKFWNKGKAVLWMWKRLAPKYTPVYVGDDETDEDAFKALRPHGLTIRIGNNKRSHAEYFINS